MGLMTPYVRNTNNQTDRHLLAGFLLSTLLISIWLPNTSLKINPL